jgi:glutathione S-transferase
MKADTSDAQSTELERQEWEPMTAYVADMSYFSGKMEAYLRYKEIDYERRIITSKVLRDEVLPATGLMKVPVIRLANGQWLKDTTPMIDWFEREFPEPPVVPEDPVLRFVSKLVEDYADEWCWRAALYWRWIPKESRRLLMSRIGHEALGDFPAPKSLAGWYYGRRQIATYLRGDGVSEATEPHVRRQYLDLLDSMSLLLADQPFLLGSHPTLVDIGMLGPMFRHYAQDPTPGRLMEERAPAVYAWVGRLWNARASRMTAPRRLSDFTHPGWAYFLEEIATNYWPFLLRSAEAWRAGESRVDHQAHGVTYRRLKVMRYRVYCLEVLQQLYAALSGEARAQVDALFAPFGGLEQRPVIESGLVEEHELPLRTGRPTIRGWRRLWLGLAGTPWDMPKPSR